VFAVTVTVQTGYPIIGAILFPVGFACSIFSASISVTGVFVLTAARAHRQETRRYGQRRAQELGASSSAETSQVLSPSLF
jgi:hypothetical protein